MDFEHRDELDRVKARRRWVRNWQGRLGPRLAVAGLFAALAVVLLCAPSVLASSTSSSGDLTWKAPFKTEWALSVRSYTDVTGCGSASKGPSFVNKTGSVTVPGSNFAATVASCASNDSTSEATSSQSLGVQLLPSFTDRGGTWKVQAHSHVSAKIQLTFVGSNCSAAEAASEFGVSLNVLDIDNAVITTIDSWDSTNIYDNVPVQDNHTISKTSTHPFNLNVALSGTIDLSTETSYDVFIIIALYVTSTVSNPISGQNNPASCEADARIAPTSGSAVVKLVKATLTA